MPGAHQQCHCNCQKLPKKKKKKKVVEVEDLVEEVFVCPECPEKDERIADLED